ncbi:MAG: 2-dehydropantoate 2-reductase [Lachnospiraceae bacterium]|nr:2-dehydropantoate 2-reductase [Lachnospiraceae bacterium]
MKINTVAVLGVGAIGGYFIWGLSEKLGDRLWVVADGERKEHLEREGLWVNNVNYPLHVRTPQEARGADLLLIATKYGALTGVLDDVAAVVDDHTIVLSLLNGVDSEEIVGARIGIEHIVPSIMKIASHRIGNRITFDGPTSLGVYFGESGQREPSERMLAIADLLDETSLHYHMREEIERDIWKKFALNISHNLPQALLGCGMGAYADSEHVAALSRMLREEVIAVAAARGIDISSVRTSLEKSPVEKSARYSTLQDLDAGRHTEIDMFSGALGRMGREAGVPTPCNDFMFHAIRALEEKNDGKFNY